MKPLCANCVEHDAKHLWGKYRLCTACRDHVLEHSELPAVELASRKMLFGGRPHGGAGYLPNADEQLDWSK